MKRPLRPPRYLPEVLQAIYALKEVGGSSSSKILSHVSDAVSDKQAYPRPRNVTTQVQRALKHALDNGIIKQRAGKFRINKSKVQEMIDPLKKTVEARRRRKKKDVKKRRRRRRVRKHMAKYQRYLGLPGDLEDDEDNDFDDDSKIDPVLCGSKRRHRRKKHGSKKSGKRRRRRRRRVARSMHAKSNTETGEYAEKPELKKNDSDKEECQKIYPDDNDSNEEGKNPDSPECDNPDCLCKIKQETEDIMDFELQDNNRDDYNPNANCDEAPNDSNDKM